MPMVAWYMLSNESYMKRVMRDVLPTAAAVFVSYRCPVVYSSPSRMSCWRTALLAQEDEPVECRQWPCLRPTRRYV